MHALLIRRQRRHLFSALVALAIIPLEGAIAYLDYGSSIDGAVANLHYLPILLAAVYFGYPGALVVSLTSIAIYHLDHFYWPGRALSLTDSDIIRLALFLVVGLVIARLMEDRRRLRSSAQELADKNAALAGLNAELQRANDNRSKFVAVASHELRSPLTVIVGNAVLLLRNELEEPQRGQLAAIVTSSKRLLLTVNNLLDLSRLEAGSYPVLPTSVDLVALVQESVQMFRTDSSDHELHIDVPENMPPVLADGEKIGRVLTNLLSNAIKYSPQGSRVTVIAESVVQSVRVGVRDEGPGIAADDLACICEPYYRAKSNGPRHPGGTGLGLAICKEIVEQHGSRLEVESEVGRGSLFSFVLPLDCGSPTADTQAQPCGVPA